MIVNQKSLCQYVKEMKSKHFIIFHTHSKVSKKFKIAENFRGNKENIKKDLNEKTTCIISWMLKNNMQKMKISGVSVFSQNTPRPHKHKSFHRRCPWNNIKLCISL